MCGIAGMWDPRLQGVDQAREIALRMGDSLSHRGPDDSGLWIDDSCMLALSHRRLSIVDVTSQGHQPMTSHSGRYVMCLNGEIYNHVSIRAAIESAGASIDNWRGRSDTEVALEAISHWGVERALREFEGMFAFALWDRTTKTLHLARDRFGEKPLYYGTIDGAFIFASELKALRVHPKWRGEIDPRSVALYFQQGYVSAPFSVYKGIKKLPAGSVLSMRDVSADTEPRPYWSVRELNEASAIAPFTGSDDDAISEMERVLAGSVQRQMIADVPLGAFLSGGIDSSLIVALMQQQAGQRTKTFTIGFSDQRFDESGFARQVAYHLGTCHEEMIVEPSQVMALIPELPYVYDEPFADTSQLPTMLICRLARETVTVALSGDGGDELFAGYNHYQWGRKIFRTFGFLSPGVRQLIGEGLVALAGLGDGRASRLRKLGELLTLRSDTSLHWGLLSRWNGRSPMRGSLQAHESVGSSPETWPRNRDFVGRQMYVDAMGFLPDDILVKVDRAAMRYGLETRAPFLSHKVAELACRLPTHMRIRNGEGKWILRRLVERFIPRQLVARPKMGFGIPLDEWLRVPLRNWATSLLDRRTISQQGFLDFEVVNRAWTEHLSNKRNNLQELWSVLMFQSWLAAEQCTRIQ
jgi:asparagine synthase (glutamine-hydrolysing)